ncbi:amidohydrolase family protein [Amycolatopsis cihanbeyliensis]|nr:amidohydrolase family protein [Amycolatopsis cihanbeyliensis]
MTDPESDADVAPWVRSLGLDGLVDIHVHFLPEQVLRKVWAYFDRAGEHYGMRWPVHYRLPEADRLAVLRSLGPIRFAPLVYPHKPGMAEWLNGWVAEFAARNPEAVATATLYPEPGVSGYLDAALRAGARCVKAHVQVGGYDPREELLDPAWGLLAEAGVPVVVHAGHGPLRGAYTGLDVFEQVLARHPRLVTVLAHAGMPDYAEAVDLVSRYPNVYLDTTMVGVPFSAGRWPLPADWTGSLARIADRVVLGTDFPNIPYPYAGQLRAIAGWAADDRLGRPFLRAVLHDTPARLLGLDPAGQQEGGEDQGYPGDGAVRKGAALRGAEPAGGQPE